MLAVLTFGLFTPTYAANANSNIPANSHGCKIQLNSIYVNTQYNPADIILNRTKTEKETKVVVKDRATGKVLDVWGEQKVQSSTIRPNFVGTMDRLVYHDKKVGPIITRLNAMLEIYQYDSFVQINKVKEMYWEEMSSGNWKLENMHTDSHMKSRPGVSVDLQGTATAVITTTSSTTGSFSISALSQVGFSVTNAYGSTYYARKHITDEFGFSVM